MQPRMTRVSFLVAQFLVRDFFSFKNVVNITPILIFLLVLDFFFFYMSSLDFISYFVSTSFIQLSGRGGYKRLSLWRVSARSQMLLTERTEQITTLGTNSGLYSLRLVCGFFNVPQFYEQ